MLICLVCALRGRVTELKCTYTRTQAGVTALDTYCDRCHHFTHYPPVAA